MFHDGDGKLKKAPEKKEGSGGGMGDDNTGGFGSSYRGIRYNIVVKRKFDSVIEKVDWENEYYSRMNNWCLLFEDMLYRAATLAASREKKTKNMRRDVSWLVSVR